MLADTYAFQALRSEQPRPVLADLSGIHGMGMIFVRFRMSNDVAVHVFSVHNF